ncbi:MAG: HD domain-containing protein [Candidatus Omnitrophica bacterium]|nr:HD domain-containing protein [Candidatus Omnitrophota bacterium]
MNREGLPAKKIRFSLSTKIIIIVMVSILSSMTLLGFLTYADSKVEIVTGLKDSLRKIVTTAALFIDGNAHNAITSTKSTPYLNTQAILHAVKTANDLEAPLYTLKKSGARNELECVVTSEPITLLGAKYKIAKEMRIAFRDGVATSTDIYKTRNGVWISAFAPIRDNADNVVALLKAQRHAGHIQKAFHERLIWIVLFCTIAFIIGSMLCVFLIQQITNGIKRLNDFAVALKAGDYDAQIEVYSNDEIGGLASTLDNMRVSLKDNIIKLKEMWLKEKRAHLESILTLSKAIEIRDPYTSGHIERVTQYSLLLAKKMNLSIEILEELKYGCMLHDLGKLGININILEKPVALTAEEREKVELHTIYGAEIIKGIKFLKMAREIALHHHERYDGKGYPFGLKGNKIPLSARIVSLADAFDAMVTDRPYRKSISEDKAFSVIKSEAGKQFDPELCYIFMELKGDIIKIKNQNNAK